jgi:AraC-like DNA-binding protein/ligand-binding sensor protein
VKPIAFEALARLPVVQYYEAAFREATGVPLRVVPPEGTPQPPGFSHLENSFCALAARTPAGCTACWETETRALQSASRKRTTQQMYCYAGLTVVAVPVVAVGGRHIATLMSGQVLRREPTTRDFLMISKMIGGGANGDWLKKARKAYFETPVITAGRFQAVLQLLNVFAQFLADSADRQLAAPSEAEPAAVANAKQYVQAHVDEPIDLTTVVEHVHVSRFYFCKLFKKATGMTLTEYVARVRVEKAKSLLAGSSMRISEVVFAAGFGSVPRFNSVFRDVVGMAPSQYRASLRPDS